MEIGSLDVDESTVTEMVACFYRRVKTDDLIGPMYPKEDWEGAEERLRDFLIFRLGGSDDYIRKRGHPRLRMRHAPFKIGEAERDRWLKLMEESIAEANVAVESRLPLLALFRQIADFMRNQ